MERGELERSVNTTVEHLENYARNLNGAAVQNVNLEKEQIIYDLLAQSFVGDRRSLRLLESFLDDPEEYTINLRGRLKEKFQQNQRLAEEIQQVLLQFPIQEIHAQERSLIQEPQQINKRGRGTQRISADKGSKIINPKQHIE